MTREKRKFGWKIVFMDFSGFLYYKQHQHGKLSFQERGESFFFHYVIQSVRVLQSEGDLNSILGFHVGQKQVEFKISWKT